MPHTVPRGHIYKKTAPHQRLVDWKVSYTLHVGKGESKGQMSHLQLILSRLVKTSQIPESIGIHPDLQENHRNTIPSPLSSALRTIHIYFSKGINVKVQKIRENAPKMAASFR